MTDAHAENTPPEGEIAAADLARHADPKRRDRESDRVGFESLPPFIGDVLHNIEGARKSLLLLLTLRTDVKESQVVYERQQREVAADQGAIVEAAIRRALKLDENAPVGDEERMRVTQLRLTNQPVDDDGLRLVAGLSALETLDLDATNVTDSGLAHLISLANLQTLYLNSTTVTDVGLAYLTTLAKLYILGLEGTQVTDAGLAHLTSLANLLSLWLDGTTVTDAGLVHLTSLANLQTLYLRGTTVTDAGLEQLATMTNLQNLSLDGTKVTDAGVAKLKEALPKCSITH